MARIKPIRVISEAVIFKCMGIVIGGALVGGILFERINPAKILPSNRRMIGLISSGLFSLIITRGRNRGFPTNVKKMIRVL